MKTKYCSGCDQTKEAKHFNTDKSRSNGLSIYCKDCIKERSAQWHQKNKDTVNKQKSVYRKTIKGKQAAKKHRQKFYATSQGKELMKRVNDKRIASGKAKTYRKNKYHSNPSFKLRTLLSCRVYGALKGLAKSQSTLELLGCSIEELKVHLEKQFQPGMSWNNYGKSGWEVDHIKPCALFDLTLEDQQKECFHYINLQPLWREDNQRKNKKYAC